MRAAARRRLPGRMMLGGLLSIAAGAAAAPAAPPSLRFSNVFQNHMVLQRDAPLDVWGFAPDSLSQLVVTLCKQSTRGGCIRDGTLTRKVAPSGGRWSAVFPSQHGGPAPMLLAVSEDTGGDYSQKLHDIVFGDVLLFSGQSNIDVSQPYAFSMYNPHALHCSKGWPWAKPNDPTMCSVLNVTKQTAEEDFADRMDSNGGLIRLMVVPNQVSGLNYTASPAAELAAVPDAPLCQPTQVDPFVECITNALRWTRANSTTIRGFSGTGWFTGAALVRAAIASKSSPDSKIPLGLLRSSWGGTRIEQWSSPAALAACPEQHSSPPKGVSTLWASMLMPLKGLQFKAMTW
eukprot:COSAG06_NODE_1106_length_10684_cov_5.383656_10_plen_346_part_00